MERKVDKTKYDPLTGSEEEKPAPPLETVPPGQPANATTATIPVALAGLQSQNGVEIAEISAGVVLAVAPLLISSRFIRNNLVRGLTLGAIK